jgi:RNA polymerase sigma-70 factor (ECF subfamily)
LPTPDADDAESLEAIRRGDPAAFEAMARRHAPRLYRTALHLTGRPEDAEDLVQEVLVKALPALRRFEGRAQLSTYLVRSLQNAWKNRLRSRSRSRVVPYVVVGSAEPGTPAIDPPDAGPSALDALEAEDRSARVRSAVARLEPDRRLALILREVEELSYEEIAAATQVPVGTVRSRLARAREDLRRFLRGLR